VPFLRVCECLDLVQRRLVEMNVISERPHIARLLPYNLGCRVLDNAGAVLVGLVGCPDEIFRRLADSPDTRIALARRAEELHDDRGQDGRLQKRPALVEKNNARLLGPTRGPVDGLHLLHLSTPTVRATETWEFIGYGAELGIYKAGQYGLKDMPTDTAAPIVAYIVDIVKNNVQFCGRSTSLTVLHTN